MVLDENKIEKGVDVDAMNRLHEQGLIPDPRGKVKSIVFTAAGLEEARRLFEQMFSSEK